jgi:hypothetical protein
MACDCQTFFTNLNLSYLDTYSLILCGENDSFGVFLAQEVCETRLTLTQGVKLTRHLRYRESKKGVKFHPK